MAYCFLAVVLMSHSNINQLLVVIHRKGLSIIQNNDHCAYWQQQQPIMCVYFTISLTSNMLTCKTPPQPVLSKQPVKLTVDSVERHAPVLFTYNQDPIVNSIQPSRSFVRWESNSLTQNEVCSFHMCAVARSELVLRNGLEITLCHPKLRWSLELSSCMFFHLKSRREKTQGRIWLRIFCACAATAKCFRVTLRGNE